MRLAGWEKALFFFLVGVIVGITIVLHLKEHAR